MVGTEWSVDLDALDARIFSSWVWHGCSVGSGYGNDVGRKWNKFEYVVLWVLY